MKISTTPIKLNPYFDNLHPSHVNYILEKNKLLKDVFGFDNMDEGIKKAFEEAKSIKIPENEKKKFEDAINDSF